MLMCIDYKILCLQLNCCQKSIFSLFAKAYACLEAIQAFESKTACVDLCLYPWGLGRFCGFHTTGMGRLTGRDGRETICNPVTGRCKVISPIHFQVSATVSIALPQKTGRKQASFCSSEKLCLRFELE